MDTVRNKSGKRSKSAKRIRARFEEGSKQIQLSPSRPQIDTIGTSPSPGAISKVIHCGACQDRIADRTYLSVGAQPWHVDCLKCVVCHRNLQWDRSCYIHGGTTYCRKHYESMTHCQHCYKRLRHLESIYQIGPYLSYHHHCLRCHVCSRYLTPGDAFTIRDHHVYCVAYQEEHSPLTQAAFCWLKGESGFFKNEDPQSTIPNTEDLLTHKFKSSTPQKTQTEEVSGSKENDIGCGTKTVIPTGSRSCLNPNYAFYNQEPHINHEPQCSRDVFESLLSEDKPTLDEPETATKLTADKLAVGQNSLDLDGSNCSKDNSVVELENLDEDFDLENSIKSSSPKSSSSGKKYKDSEKNKRVRTSFKHQQLSIMRSYFEANRNPDSKELRQLSQTTGLTKRVLQVWFQNARAKYRRSLNSSNAQYTCELDSLGPFAPCSSNPPNSGQSTPGPFQIVPIGACAVQPSPFSFQTPREGWDSGALTKGNESRFSDILPPALMRSFSSNESTRTTLVQSSSTLSTSRDSTSNASSISQFFMTDESMNELNLVYFGEMDVTGTALPVT